MVGISGIRSAFGVWSALLMIDLSIENYKDYISMLFSVTILFSLDIPVMI